MAKQSIDELLSALKEKRATVTAQGDQKRIEKQHAKGKLFARERIERLLDEGSFSELDMFVKHRCTNFGMESVEAPGEGVVTGYGTINGRLVYIFSQDFTVLGGSLGEAHASKIAKVMRLAMKAGAPVIGIADSGGARIQEGVDSLHGYGQIFYNNVQASGVIPQISVICGPCAGGAVYSPALTDFIIMVDNTANMFITGPQVIKAVTGEEIDPEELGGANTHNSVSGNSQLMYADEDTCFEGIKELLSYLPQNNMENPPQRPSEDPVDRCNQALITSVPTDNKAAYDVRDVITKIVDDGDFFELHGRYAMNMVVGYAHLNGMPVGIVANQPNHFAGSIDINASDKAARFIRTCDAFNVPLLTFVDTPGYLPGKNQEFGGIIRHGAKILYAYSEATVPKLTVTLRKSYGGAHIAMCNKDLGADLIVAWPQAEIAVMGAQGAANIIYRKDIKSSDDPEKTRVEKIDEYEQQFANPYQAAARGLIDMVISPEETRPTLIKALRALKDKRENTPPKKHGNMPL